MSPYHKGLRSWRGAIGFSAAVGGVAGRYTTLDAA